MKATPGSGCDSYERGGKMTYRIKYRGEWRQDADAVAKSTAATVAKIQEQGSRYPHDVEGDEFVGRVEDRDVYWRPNAELIVYVNDKYVMRVHTITRSVAEERTNPIAYPTAPHTFWRAVVAAVDTHLARRGGGHLPKWHVVTRNASGHEQSRRVYDTEELASAACRTHHRPDHSISIERVIHRAEVG